MSIRLRLLLSYLTMIVVPILFTVVSVVLVVMLFRGDIKALRNIYLPLEDKQNISAEDQLILNIHKEVVLKPKQFLKTAYLKKMDQQFQSFHSALVVRKGNQIIYSPLFLKRVDADDFPPFGFTGEVEPVEKIDNQYVSIKQLDFLFPDKTEGTLFFVTDASGLVTFVRSFFPVIFIVLIGILIGTNGILTYFVSKSIIRPVRELQKAAKRMKEGNLDFEIKAASKDELGQLAQGFEEMRVRLKESIDLQLAYEENRKELIANISHDLKTPITSIKGYVEGIRDGVANSPEKQKRYIQTIYSKANDLDHLIDELFLYSKLDLQRLPFHYERIHFDHYLKDLMEEIGYDLEEMKVQLHLDIEKDGDYLVMADREHLKRVITNIVDNSIKYNEKEEKRLHFTLSSLNTFILFQMEDNGPGIDADNLPFIFDQFYRADSARGTDRGGSGLGLSIAKRIIEEHQGTIWAESKRGEGTTILFKLKKVGADFEKDSHH